MITYLLYVLALKQQQTLKQIRPTAGAVLAKLHKNKPSAMCSNSDSL